MLVLLFVLSCTFVLAAANEKPVGEVKPFEEDPAADLKENLADTTSSGSGVLTEPTTTEFPDGEEGEAERETEVSDGVLSTEQFTFNDFSMEGVTVFRSLGVGNFEITSLNRLNWFSSRN